MDGSLSILDALKLVAPEKTLKWQGWADKLATQDIETVADLKALQAADYEKLTQTCTPLLSSTIIIIRSCQPEEKAESLAVSDRDMESLTAQLEDLRAQLAVKDRDMEEMAVIFDEMNGEKERASTTATQCKLELESLRAQLSVAQSEVLAQQQHKEMPENEPVFALAPSSTELDKGKIGRAHV